MKKEIKIEWCENWIKHTFKKLLIDRGMPDGGIETSCFWKLAEQSGLWVKGTYGSSMSKALSKLTSVEIVSYDGKYVYSIFKLKGNIAQKEFEINTAEY